MKPRDESQVHQIELAIQNEALRETRQALEESRDRYWDLYEFAPVGYLTVNADGLIEEVNLAGARLLGVERQQLRSCRLAHFIAPADRDQWQQYLLDALQHDEPASCEIRMQHGNGTLLTVLLECRSMATAGVAPALRITLTDITRYKQLEDNLKASQAQYLAMVHSSEDGIWMLDKEGRLIAVNDAYARRSGYSRAELLTMHIADLEAQESLPQVRAHIQKIIRTGSDQFETQHRTKAGKVWPAEVSVSYSEVGGGRFFGFLRDMTERKRAEAALQEMRSEMEQVMRFHVASQSVAALAHELNQPLNAIASYSAAALNMLSDGNPHPEKLLHALKSNAQQAQRAGNVVHELMAFLNKGEVATAPVDLNELLQDTLSRIRKEGLGDFYPYLELAPGLPPVDANRLQIQKVMINLIQNGIEAMHSVNLLVGEITITMRTSADGQMAQVTVCDNGPGIDATTLHRIFDPFFTTKPKGLGMGLAISRAIVEAHGGQLWAEFEPANGASFHFTLPFTS